MTECVAEAMEEVGVKWTEELKSDLVILTGAVKNNHSPLSLHANTAQKH